MGAESKIEIKELKQSGPGFSAPGHAVDLALSSCLSKGGRAWCDRSRQWRTTPKPSPLSKLLPLGEGPMLLQKAARHPSLRIIQWGRRGPTEGNCLFLQPPSASRSRSAWPAVRQQSARPAVSRCRCLGPGQSVHHCSAGVTILGRLF